MPYSLTISSYSLCLELEDDEDVVVCDDDWGRFELVEARDGVEARVAVEEDVVDVVGIFVVELDDVWLDEEDEDEPI